MLSLHNRVTTNSGGMSSMSSFNLPSALHEWNIQNAAIVGTTMTVPDTGSIGGITLINPTAIQLPSFSTINSKKSAVSDGVNDILQNSSVSDFRGSDNTGVMHFVFRTKSAPAQQVLFSVSKSGVTTDRFLVLLTASAEPRLIVSSSGTNSLLSGAALSNNTDYILTVMSDGALIKGYIGTSLQWNSAGASGINWFGNIAGTTTGVEILSREIGTSQYQISDQAYICYTPYIDVATALADQLLIANDYGITV